MSKIQFAVQMGMGTDLKGQDFTKAACRAVQDALHRNFLSVAPSFGFPHDAMIVDIRVGVSQPDAVDLDAVRRCAPVGTVSAEAVVGGLEVEMRGQQTIVANAIVTVSFDVKKEG